MTSLPFTTSHISSNASSVAMAGGGPAKGTEVRFPHKLSSQINTLHSIQGNGARMTQSFLTGYEARGGRTMRATKALQKCLGDALLSSM